MQTFVKTALFVVGTLDFICNVIRLRFSDKKYKNFEGKVAVFPIIQKSMKG